MPEYVQETSNSVNVINLEVFLDEYKIVNDEIADPLEFVRLIAVLIVVPSAQVLAYTLAIRLNVREKDCLYELIRF